MDILALFPILVEKAFSLLSPLGMALDTGFTQMSSFHVREIPF